MIYFVQHGTEGNIKIGWSKDVDRRIGDFRRQWPPPGPVLLVSCGGSHADEQMLHAALSQTEHHISGEWYHASIKEFALSMLGERRLYSKHIAKHFPSVQIYQTLEQLDQSEPW